MAAAKLEYRLGARRSDDVNNPARILLLTQTFEDHVVALWLLILHQIVTIAFSLHHQRVRRFADLALESLPEVG